MRVDQVTDPITYHGEGPVWLQRWGLRWYAGNVDRLWPSRPRSELTPR